MIAASLKGLSEDGTHLIVVTDAGDEFRVAVTDELRALVRHARVTIRDERPESTGMTPREIQQRIRAGLNAAELAHLTGEPVEALAKFEAPVLAERSYIVDLARSTRIGRDATSPTLGDLVGDRLAGRGIDPTTVEWDAWREVDEPWRVAADFVTAGRAVRALWTFDHVAKALTAEDDEATWLTETELLEAPIPRRHLAAVRAHGPATGTIATPLTSHGGATHEAASGVTGEDSSRDDQGAEELSPADALLAELAERRGTREPVEIDEDEEDDEAFEGFGPRRGAVAPTPGTSPLAGSHPARPPAVPHTSMPHPAGSARDQSPTGADSRAAGGSDSPGTRQRKGRASIPSWDEIVFGAKND